MTEVLDLPLPLSRTDLYLAKAAGMAGVTLPDEPIGREEQFLAVIAGDTSVELPAPANLTEVWLAFVAGIEPSPLPALEGAFWVGQQKVDVRYFAVAAGMVGATLPPAPQNRTEQYWAKIAEVKPIHGVLKYATGINIYLTDVVKGIDELQFIYGDATQQTYSGKNLCQGKDYSAYGVDTDYDATTGVFNVSGTPSATVVILSANIYQNIPAGSYTFSTTKASTFVKRIRAFHSDDSYEEVSIAANATTATKTFAGDIVRYNILAADLTTGVAINDSFKLQLETGSTATSWEPYTGGIPAPNPSYPQDVNVVTGAQNVLTCGKNLLSAQRVVTDSNNADTYITADNNYVRFKTGGNPMVIVNPIQQSGALTFTGVVKSDVATTNAINFVAEYSDGTTANLTGVTTTDTDEHTFTITTDNSKTLVSLTSRNTYNKVAYLKINGSMLELGSATAYEPYQGQSYNVDLTSKNILNFGSGTFGVSATFTNGNAIETHDTNSVVMESTGTTGAQYVRWITGELDSTKTYYLSFKAKKIVKGTDGEPIIQIIRHGSNDLSAWTNLGSTGTVVAAPVEGTEYSLGATLSGYKYYRFYIYNNANTPVTVGEKTAYYDIQLELGSTATPYVPYREPIELCKIGDYQDYIYKSGSDWYVHKDIGKIILDGTETGTWNLASGTGRYSFWIHSNQIPNAITTNPTPKLCDRFIYSDKAFNAGAPIPSLCENSNTTNVLFIFNTDGTEANTVVGWRSWLSTHNTTVYYPIATPTDTEITDANLIAELNAIDSATLPKPDANITLTATSPNLPASIKISYYGEEE